jgi:hypothetical protein
MPRLVKFWHRRPAAGLHAGIGAVDYDLAAIFERSRGHCTLAGGV